MLIPLSTNNQVRYGPIFHIVLGGSFLHICKVFKGDTKWILKLKNQIYESGKKTVYWVESVDMVHWEEAYYDDLNDNRGMWEPVYQNIVKSEKWGGKVQDIIQYEWAGKTYEIAVSKDIKKKGFRYFLSQIFESKSDELVPLDNIKHIRIWERQWKQHRLNEAFKRNLRFRVSPGIWPDIRILEAEGNSSDIYTNAYELELEISLNKAQQIEIEICGCKVTWFGETKSLICGETQIKFPVIHKLLKLHMWYDCGIIEILIGGKVVIEYSERKEIIAAKPQEGIAGNIDFKIPNKEMDFLLIRDSSGTAEIVSAKVYGLRNIQYPAKYGTLSNWPKGEVIYRSKSYTVWETCVEDSCYGEPPAYVLQDGGILSWPRVVEEFTWRKTPWGDMSRQVCRKPYYRPELADIDIRFPKLQTGIPVLDTAYKIACDVFALCSSEEYSMPGQEGMWSAGLFQGEGESFGVWLRDTVHVAIRCGSLIDRNGARLSLCYTANQGFDNGEDGPAMSAVGIWDYYCATHDINIIYETWPALCERIKQAMEKYDTDQGLVWASKSTSNDAFDEPEAAGFCLGTEVYYMEAFLCMERMGSLIGEKEELIRRFGEIGRGMKNRIRKVYWKENAGYFTGGPKGSESYEKNYWETSGEEAAVWKKFGIADDRQKRLILDKIEKTAMTEFGIDLFPYRNEKNHFCHSSWGVWNAGFASAACEIGNSELIWKLIMQQVRNVIFNKTFYEVIDLESGRAWRWPGQLWHAAGFISTIYFGILGISYDINGMYMKPVRQKNIKEICLKNLRFGMGIYDITSCGNGDQIYLDGCAVDYIPADLEGRHEVLIKK